MSIKVLYQAKCDCGSNNVFPMGKEEFRKKDFPLKCVKCKRSIPQDRLVFSMEDFVAIVKAKSVT